MTAAQPKLPIDVHTQPMQRAPEPGTGAGPHAHSAPTVRVALLGCGNVGGALAEILLTRADDVADRTGIRLELVGIAVANPDKPRPAAVEPALVGTDAAALVSRDDVDVVVEVIGGLHPAHELVETALRNGKPVVTGNKALLAVAGAELAEVAASAGVDLLYEAAVAGAIPVIRPLRESLAGEQIVRIMGIVNGTTNYILTRMEEEGDSYDDVLREAQALGLAERDPTADVEGHDAAAKAAILAALAFGSDVVDADVYREGITAVSASDVAYAARLGYSVKLLAIAELVDGGPEVSVRVHPAMVPRTHPLASVRGAFNAVFVEGAVSGELMLYGRGAGGGPTASAMLGDLVDASRNLLAGAPAPAPKRTSMTVRRAERPALGLLSLHGRGGPPRGPRLGGQDLRRPQRVHPLHGAGRPRRGGAADLPHPRGARGRPFGDDRRAAPAPGGRPGQRRAPRDRRARRGRGVTPGWRGVVTEYRDFLPVTERTPVVTLLEGGTPLVPAPRLSERVGAQVWLKVEGANPTGSFKDRGMTMAISMAVEEGAKAVVCASTGNTSASAAAYASRAGLACVVLIPDGHIALGKLAQALMHGARVLQVRGNFDQLLTIVRDLPNHAPITVVNSVNPHRIEGQKTGAFEIVDVLGDAPDVHCIPVGNAGNISAYWRGYLQYKEAGRATKLPRMMGFQAAGAAPIVLGHPVERPETIATAIRIGNPASWYSATAAASESGGSITAVSDDEIMDAYTFLAKEESVFCEAASSASVAGLLKEGVPAGSRVVCVLTGHGLKDPDLAIKAISVPTVIDLDLETVLAEISL